MVFNIGIDPFTVPALDPVAFIRAAAGAGFTHLSLRTIQPERASNPGGPIVDDRNLNDVRAILADTGLVVAAVDIVDVSSAADFDAVERGLHIAAALGSPSVSVIAKSRDLASVDDGLGLLCEIALPLGISPRLEPISYLPVGPLATTRELVLRHPGSGLMIDSLHLHRLEASAEEVRDATEGLPITLQINGVDKISGRDAAHLASGSGEPDPRRWEALDGRLLPGEGENDIASLVALLPAGVVPIVEAPNSRRVARTDPADYLSAAHRAALAALVPTS